MYTGFADSYFLKHTFLIPQITEPPAGLLCYCVVIPAYMEENLVITLNGLKKADKPKGDIEVLTVINFSESDTKENKLWSIKQYNDLTEWSKNHLDSRIRFWIILADDLPKKHAGAGLARKIGMDLALQRFNRINNSNGIILSLDADTQIEDNYFTAIETYFTGMPDAGGCIIRFAHSFNEDFISEDIKKAITGYELHLRYYKNILHHIGFPFARYTIGSCFGVRAGVYARYGGMNKKKAGEDFYFLHKLFPHETFIEVNNTCVHPSSRPSLRVPFGTGPVIHKMMNSGSNELLTYHPQAFYDLKKFLESVDTWYGNGPEKLRYLLEDFSDAIKEFLLNSSFLEKMEEIRQNTATVSAFRKRFFLWFNGFRVVKYLNCVHSKYYTKIPVRQAVLNFLSHMGKNIEDTGEYNLLIYLREIDSEN